MLRFELEPALVLLMANPISRVLQAPKTGGIDSIDPLDEGVVVEGVSRLRGRDPPTLPGPVTHRSRIEHHHADRIEPSLSRSGTPG